jgi:hypothetical protein
MGEEEDAEREAQGPKPHEEQSSRQRIRTRAQSETPAKNSKLPLSKNKTNTPRPIRQAHLDARRLRCVDLEARVDACAAGRRGYRYTGAGRTRRRPQPIPCSRERLRGQEHVVILGPLRHLYIHTLPRADVQYGRRGVPGVDGSENVRVDA